MSRADDNAPRSPLIVTGCVRSGTTILQRVLHRHPDIGLTNELQSFLGLGQRAGPTYLREVLRRGARRRNRHEVFDPETSYLSNVMRSLRFAGRIDFVETLPRLPNGKIQKRTLRAPYWEHVDRAI